MSPFTGTLDGAGFSINNLTIMQSTNVGLIGFLGPGGVVKDLRLTNANVNGGDNVGALVGWNDRGTVQRCMTSGQVTGNENVGGLVGANYGTIEDSYSLATVSGQQTLGGLVGDCGSGPWDGRGVITRAYTAGAVIQNPNQAGYAAGICGRTGGAYGGQSQISDTFTVSTVTGGGVVSAIIGWSYSVLLSNVHYLSTDPQFICAPADSSGNWEECFAHSAQSDFMLPSNAPINSWNFSTVWMLPYGGLPQLIPFPY